MKLKDFIKAHPVGGWCNEGARSRKVPALKFGKLDVPKAVDNREYCTAIEDQGAKPWCAAYTAAAFAENVLWRRDGRIKQVEPDWIYQYAKAHDGDPDGDGTTLDCVLEALRDRKVFDPSVCRVRTIFNTEDVKAAIHRFGCILGGFNITDEWYDLANGHRANVTGEKPHAQHLGGHAVLVCGYTQAGVWIENSWGGDWGRDGFGFVEWPAFRRQWMYGTVLTNCLNGFK